MDVFAFVEKWEGGLSNNPKDKASADPVPGTYKGKTGWHTNKGITWATFKSLAGKLGYSPTPEVFFAMPADVWKKIAKNGYWDAFGLDALSKTRVSNCVFTWAWGSGVGGTTTQLIKFQRAHMGVQAQTLSRTQLVSNFEKSSLTDAQLFVMLCDWREAYFRSLNSPFLQGWLNRLNDFRKTFA